MIEEIREEKNSNLSFSFVGPDFFQSLVSLVIVAASTVGAGLLLATQTDKLDLYPGLLLMVPAAVALRGMIFGPLGSRLSTAIHAGTYKFSLSPSSVMGENILAAAILSLTISYILAIFAKAVGIAFGISDTISVDRFVVISVVGGMLASVILTVFSVGLVTASVRFGWNPDNVTAPLVTAIGDLSTIPALIVVATFLDSDLLSVSLFGIITLLAILSIVLVSFKGRKGVQDILIESVPILGLAMFIDLLAGYSLERQSGDFLNAPTLLILFPSYLAVAGALGGALSSRFATRLHLGMMEPRNVPDRKSVEILVLFIFVAIPVYFVIAGFTLAGAGLFGLVGPGWMKILSLAFLGGVMTTAVVLVVGYYGTIASYRLGADPDTYSIPIITSVLDLFGALTLALSIGILNVF